ncbi:hypothetical protein WISP_106285 [Willisornis vidua]|uniref:Uncharacterized protein n=1 Tax=Willisornis vidua TaxID=1566151 RepID=A0ABQ9CX34_9PASS|nr:hypothetical protein WISP_106285 [Willisornis vidua]
MGAVRGCANQAGTEPAPGLEASQAPWHCQMFADSPPCVGRRLQERIPATAKTAKSDGSEYRHVSDAFPIPCSCEVLSERNTRKVPKTAARIQGEPPQCRAEWDNPLPHLAKDGAIQPRAHQLSVQYLVQIHGGWKNQNRANIALERESWSLQTMWSIPLEEQSLGLGPKPKEGATGVGAGRKMSPSLKLETLSCAHDGEMLLETHLGSSSAPAAPTSAKDHPE